VVHVECPSCLFEFAKTGCLARIFRQGPKTPMMVSNSVVARIRVRWSIMHNNSGGSIRGHRSSAVICKGG